MGCGGQSSHAHVPRRGPGGLAGYSVFRPGRRLAGKLLNCRSPRVCQRLPVRRPIDHWPDSGRSPRPPTPASPATSLPTGRWPGAYFCRIRLGLSVLSARARRTRCYPWRRVRRVQRLACGTCGRRSVPTPKAGWETRLDAGAVSRQRIVRVFHAAGAIHRPAGPGGTGGVRERVWPRCRGAGRRWDADVVSGVRVFGVRCVRRIELKDRSMRCASWSRPVTDGVGLVGVADGRRAGR